MRQKLYLFNFSSIISKIKTKNKSNQKVQKHLKTEMQSFKMNPEKINRIIVIQKLVILFQTNLSRQIHIVSTHTNKWND